MDAPLPLHQYILYKIEPKGTKWNKVPVSPEGISINPHIPQNWMSYEKALEISQSMGDNYRVGFVFTAEDPYWFLDIDNAWDGKKWSETALALLNIFAGCAVEVSISGKGLHVIGRGAVPEGIMSKNIELGIEFYTHSRFMALGHGFTQGSTEFDATQALQVTLPLYFKPKEGVDTEWTNAPLETYTGPADDDELMKMAFHCATKSDFFKMDGLTFIDLWDGNKEMLADRYPDPERDYDASSADMALATHLAFWTGQDCERIQRLMLRSKLVREKWTKRKDYLKRTILNAVGCNKRIYDKERATDTDAIEEIGLRGDNPFCDAETQLRKFANCVYIADQHKILIDNGMMLKPESFNTKYGGYVYILDDEGKSTKKPFDIFSLSQRISLKKADTTCFRPDLPFQSIVESDEFRKVNVYRPVIMPRSNAAVDPFLKHMENLLPVQRDRDIMFSWMAAVLRYKGKKFYWAPLIQGAPGNGKTLITEIMSELLGHQYVHRPLASDIDNKFNAWMLNRLLIAVEDIYVPDSKAMVMETLKPMITGTRIDIQGKGADQVTKEVCANFLFNSNHKDAVIKSKDDRRLAVFFSNQQSADDIILQGMSGNYFPNLYNWLRSDGF
jgi:hypothetical protein